MNRVAWLTCALLAVAETRKYARCELAHYLLNFGIAQDHIATWVCIAYHESRFETSATNDFSGDHGIFQISQLYWCGPGKACGKPCSAFRDEDIGDDLTCALQIHEEHTRLQGDGFLAWVVYPQHCRQNVKKYLIDCEMPFKTAMPITQSRAFAYDNIYRPNVTNYNNIDSLLPPYLTIGSIFFRGHYGKVLDINEKKVDWYNYKFDNIDALKLPVFTDTVNAPVSTTPATTTTTSTTTTSTYVPPVKPWRTIETNQFRKRLLKHDNNTSKSPDSDSKTELTTTRKTLTTWDKQVFAETTSTANPSSLNSFQSLPPSFTNARQMTTTTQRPYKFDRNTILPTTVPFTKTTRLAPITTKFETTTAKPNNALRTTSFTSRYRSVTDTPTINRRYTTTTTTTKRPISPSSFVTRISSTARSTPVRELGTTNRPKTAYSWFTSRTDGTTATTKSIPHATTSRPVYTSTTFTPRTKVTQNIFDSYLNPTKPPKLPSFNFSTSSDSLFKVQIFSGGTTARPLQYWRSRTRQAEKNISDHSNNDVTRQIRN